MSIRSLIVSDEMRKATRTLATFALCLLVFAAGANAAQGTRTETKEVTVNGPPLGPPEVWVGGDGVQHGRGLVFPADVIGEGGGTHTITLDWDLDLSTGNGSMKGTYVRDWTVKGTSGTFEGRFRATILNFMFFGRSFGRGSDGFDGMTYRGNFSGVWQAGGSLGTGVIYDPKGEF